MNRRLLLLLGVAVVLVGIGFYFSSLKSSWLFSEISNGGRWFLPVLIVSALVDSTNPCAFSVLLLTIAFLFSLGKVRKDILQAGGLYILAIFLVYLLIGLGILQALHFFNTPHFMAKVGAIVLIALGLINLINVFFPRFPLKLGIPHAAHKKMAEVMAKASLAAAFGLGILVGLCEFPCTGGPYLTVLGLLHDRGEYWLGFGYLLLFNLIFVLPLVVTLLIASNSALLEKFKAWRTAEAGNMRFWTGLIMVVLGLVIFAL